MRSRRLRTRWLAAGMTAALLSGGGVAAAESPASIAAARLQGMFALSGRVTVARNIPGEFRGQLVQRRWEFLPSCAAGPCSTVTVVRGRAAGTDRVALTRRGPGTYVGTGSFTAPLRCGGRVVRPGERVPFTLRVQVVTASVTASDTVATRVDATYVNRSRINLTSCVAFLGHDSARYHGFLVAPPPA